MQGVSLFLVLACFDKYQHAVLRYDDLFLFGRNGRVLILTQGFLDLLFDFQQGSVQCGCLGSDSWEVRNMGGAAICRECAKHRIRLVLNGDTVPHKSKIRHYPLPPRSASRSLRVSMSSSSAAGVGSRRIACGWARSTALPPLPSGR